MVSGRQKWRTHEFRFRRENGPLRTVGCFGSPNCFCLLGDMYWEGGDRGDEADIGNHIDIKKAFAATPMCRKIRTGARSLNIGSSPENLDK